MITVFNEDKTTTFSRPDSHLIQMCHIESRMKVPAVEARVEGCSTVEDRQLHMLCSSSILVRVYALGIGLPVDSSSQYRYRGATFTLCCHSHILL